MQVEDLACYSNHKWDLTAHTYVYMYVTPTILEAPMGSLVRSGVEPGARAWQFHFRY